MQRRPLECFVAPHQHSLYAAASVPKTSESHVIRGNLDSFDQFARAFLMSLMTLSPLPLDQDG